MKIINVRYTVNQAFVEVNQRNVDNFISDLEKFNNPALRYMTLLGADGKTFHHFALYDNEKAQKLLLELPSFQAFQTQRDQSRLESKPQIEELKLIAASFPIFNI